MGNDSIGIKIAKIESGIDSLHEKIDSLVDSMGPVIAEQKKHHEDILTIKRDRFWLFALGSAGLLSPIYAIFKVKQS